MERIKEIWNLPVVRTDPKMEKEDVHAMKNGKKCAVLFVLCGILAAALTGCADAGEKRIVRIGHNQSANHPTHIALEAFREFIHESELGEEYIVEIYPNELLGSQTDMVQLTQTGAIDYCIASNAILETFSKNYEIFNLPYLFASVEAYHTAMDDPEVTGPIFKATEKAGFTAVTWLDAGTRNFYTIDQPIESPSDLKGLKIRVQQSPTNIEMMRLLGGSATPMGFGEVYTALQSNIIDGAENNEMALTDNGHGDVCKYYSYDMHQMVPDILIGNDAFMEEMDEEERAVFEQGYELINSVQREEWVKAVENAKERAQTKQNVTFLYPDQMPFVNACRPLHETVLENNPAIVPIYERIREYNARYPSVAE